MRSILPIVLLLTIIVSVLLLSCGPTYIYEIPEQTDDGWQTASLEEVGLDGRKLSELIDDINRNKYENVHSVLIVKDGKLVFEEYFPGYKYDFTDTKFRGEYTEFGKETIHGIASVTKAFTSALIGIAIDQGFISSEDEKLITYFPEYVHLFDENKDLITIKHLLTMTSGLDWNQMDVPLTDMDRNDLIQLFIVEDPFEYILSKTVIADPGTRWYYSGGDVNLLGEVIRRATDKRMEDFAEQYLFGPLGINEYEWAYINSDIILASGDLKLRPRDMAKLGYLYLNMGVWNGKRIISRKWTEDSTREFIPIPRPGWIEAYGDGYGYQWWLRTDKTESESYRSFLRTGWGGQRISVYPEVNMVVVLTGNNRATPEPVNEIISQYILPAVR